MNKVSKNLTNIRTTKGDTAKQVASWPHNDSADPVEIWYFPFHLLHPLHFALYPSGDSNPGPSGGQVMYIPCIYYFTYLAPILLPLLLQLLPLIITV